MSIASDVLTKAADLIEQTGWTQGQFARDIEGRCVIFYSEKAICYCAAGAIKAVENRRTHWPSKIECLFAAYIAKTYGFNSVVQWNDHPDRTKDDVVIALRDAARGFSRE